MVQPAVDTEVAAHSERGRAADAEYVEGRRADDRARADGRVLNEDDGTADPTAGEKKRSAPGMQRSVSC